MSGGKYSNCSHLDTTLPFCVDKPVRFIIRLLFGFASDSVFDKLNQSTNGETAMQCCLLLWVFLLAPTGALCVVNYFHFSKRNSCLSTLSQLQSF